MSSTIQESLPSATALTSDRFLIGRSCDMAPDFLTLCYDAEASEPHWEPTSTQLILPVRADVAVDPFAIRLPSAAVQTAGPITYWRGDGQVVGIALIAVRSGHLMEQSRNLYRALLETCRGLHLYRVWNWIPDINRNAPRQDEHYRLFCAGRAHAFNERFANHAAERMSAATGVGLNSDHLVVCFVAGDEPTIHRENPRQMPAYRYPESYGPCPPSFVRATQIESDQPWTFISGTASIIESETQCVDDLGGQLRVTLENLILVGVNRSFKRFFRVYLRQWSDLQAVRNFLETHLLKPNDAISYLQADLCRADLLVEIEACFKG